MATVGVKGLVLVAYSAVLMIVAFCRVMNALDTVRLSLLSFVLSRHVTIGLPCCLLIRADFLLILLTVVSVVRDSD